jgi:hypothetical protein
MFKPLSPDAASRVRVTIGDRTVYVSAGISVAAAMFQCGEEFTRTTPVSGAPRAPYCLMGACFECLMEIDGIPNCQACLVVVREGMRIVKAEGAREAPL